MPAYDPETLVINAMLVEDLGEVLAIEQTASPAPWTEHMFRRELLLPLARNLTARVWGARIAGYLNFWLIAGEVQIHNIAVRKDLQRQGVASALLSAMIGMAFAAGARHATLEVRASNEPAKRLYEQFGFEVRGIRPLYYDDSKEDALIMWADLEERLDGQ